VRAVDLAHAAGADERFDSIRTNGCAGLKMARLTDNPVGQKSRGDDEPREMSVT